MSKALRQRIVEHLKKEEVFQINLQQFWNIFQSPQGQEQLNHFIHSIFDHLLSSEKKVCHENEEAMLSTVLVLQFYSPTNLFYPETVANCRRQFEEKRKQLSDHTKWILNQYLQRNSIPISSTFCREFISRMLFAPKKIIWDNTLIRCMGKEIKDCEDYVNKVSDIIDENDYAALKLCSYPQQNGVERKSIGYGYVCYLDLVRKNGLKVEVELYEHMRDIFKLQYNALGQISGTVIPYMCNLIHLITQSIRFFGCSNLELLKQLLIWFNQLRGCSESLGDLGAEVFEILHKEIKAPGSAFRFQLSTDFPALSTKESKFLNKPFYLVIKDSLGREEQIKAKQLLEEPEYCSLTTLRKLILWQIVKTSSLEEAVMTKAKKLLRVVENQQVYVLYMKAMKIVELASSLQNYQKIKQIQKQSMMELLGQYQEGENEKMGGSQDDFDLLCKDHELGFFEYPTYEIVNVNMDEIIGKVKSQYNLQQLAKKNKIQFPKLSYYQNKIPIIFCGDGHQFTKIVTVVAQYLQKADFQTSKSIKIYYIPGQDPKYKIGIAQYLASKDIWYRRFIYNPCRDKLLYPSPSFKDWKKNSLPSELFKKTLHMYLREAKKTFPLRIFKCSLKLAEEGNKIVYMTSFMMMGLFAEAELIRKHKMMDPEKMKKYSKMENIEIISEKIKKSNPMSLSMVYMEYDRIEEMAIKKNQSYIMVEDLQICNLPREYFMGNAPDPTSHQLQMSVLTDKYGKIFRRQLSNRDNFKNVQGNQLRQAFKQLFACSSINNIFIESLYPIPCIVIDGVFYHDINSIDIQPVISVNEVPITIPIQCFMDFK